MPTSIPPRTRLIRPRPWLCALLVLLPLLGVADRVPAGEAGSGEIAAGDSLEEALGRLQDAGVPVVFTSQLVRPEMRVLRSPTAERPREILEQLLAPHGLDVRDGPGGRLLVVPAAVPADHADEAAPEGPVSTTRETIEVVASRPWILGDTPSALALRREDLLALPHVGDDIFRSLTLLPGTSHDDASAKLSVRGGLDDELLIRLDGVEIVEPYHLQDFGGVLGILAPQIIGRVELLTGGFPAEFGDRLSGVLELETVEPSWRRRSELGLNLFDLRATSSGVGRGGRISWLGSARGGSLEIPFRFAEQEERPTFWDTFAKLDYRLAEDRSFGASVLASGDRLRFAQSGEDDEVLERFDTRYRTTYAWLHHQEIFSASFFVDSRLVGSRVERDRRGLRDDADLFFDLQDQRDAGTVTLAQDWHWQVDARKRLRWGLDLRHLDVDYDYRNDRASEDFLSLVREDGPSSTTVFEESFTGEHVGAWISGQLRPSPRLTVEAGLRFDRNTVLDEDHVLSPRLAASYTPAAGHLLHAAAGRYTQSQRLYELQVEDGVLDFTPSERAEYWSLGYERVFPRRGAARRPLTLRAEIYQRVVDDPRPRFENLYEPISKVPELEADRIRLAPTRSLARGFELFVGGAAGRRVDWFATYTFSRTEDRLDDGHGLRDVPRQKDQPHSLRLDVAYHAPGGWDLQVAWHSRTGWPTTELEARRVEEPGGEARIVPVLGPLRDERLPDYHRLDLRLARTFQLPKGELYAYVEVQNALSRRNVRGFDVSLEARPDGSVDVRLEENSWGRFFPSFGVRWSF